MINYKDIRGAVVRQLKKTGIEVSSRDVTEGFIRPSFFIELSNVNRSGDRNQVHKSLSIQIYFFPTDRYEYAIEVLNMQEELENLFDLKLTVKDRHFNVEEFSTFLNDGVLNCSFDMEFEEGRVYEGLENDWVDVEFPRPGPTVPDPSKPNDPDAKVPDPDYEKNYPVEKMHELDIDK